MIPSYMFLAGRWGFKCMSIQYSMSNMVEGIQGIWKYRKTLRFIGWTEAALTVEIYNNSDVDGFFNSIC